MLQTLECLPWEGKNVVPITPSIVFTWWAEQRMRPERSDGYSLRRILNTWFVRIWSGFCNWFLDEIFYWTRECFNGSDPPASLCWTKGRETIVTMKQVFKGAGDWWKITQWKWRRLHGFCAAPHQLSSLCFIFSFIYLGMIFPFSEDCCRIKSARAWHTASA